MRHRLLLCACASIALFGAGCSLSGSANVTNPAVTPTPAPSAPTQQPVIPPEAKNVPPPAYTY